MDVQLQTVNSAQIAQIIISDAVILQLQTVDPAPIPAAQKASLRDQLAALQKRVLEGQKKASAANKQRATQAAVADADAAVAAGQKFGVIRVDVGLDPKALLEAWNAIQKQHAKLPVIMFSSDQGKSHSHCTLPLLYH